MGDIVSLLHLLAQDALASACPQHDRTVHSSSANSPLPWSILQRWDHPAWSWGAELKQITGPGRGHCCQSLSFFNVSPTHCLLMGAFSQGKSVFPSLTQAVKCFFALSVLAAILLYQPRAFRVEWVQGEGQELHQVLGSCCPRAEPGPAFGRG